MAGKGVEAGRAYLKLDVDEAAFNKKLGGVARSLKNTGKAITGVGLQIGGLGAAIVAPLALATRKFVDLGDQLNKTAARTGLSVQALSELKFAAEQSGGSLGDVDRALKSMSKSLEGAKDGSASMVDAYQKLGLSVRELSGLAPEQQLEAIFAAIAKVEDPTQRAALAMQVLGKSGATLLPMAGNMKALRKEANDLGITMSDETAQSAADLADTLNRVTATLTAAAVQVGAALAPALVVMGDYLAAAISKSAKFIENNRTLILVLATIGAALTATGTVLAGIGAAFTIASVGVSSLITAFTFLAAHPVVAALLLIGSALAGIYFYFKGIGDEATSAASKVKAAGAVAGGSGGDGAAKITADAKRIQKQAAAYQANYASVGAGSGTQAAGASDVDRKSLAVLKQINEGTDAMVDLLRRGGIGGALAVGNG